MLYFLISSSFHYIIISTFHHHNQTLFNIYTYLKLQDKVFSKHFVFRCCSSYPKWFLENLLSKWLKLENLGFKNAVHQTPPCFGHHDKVPFLEIYWFERNCMIYFPEVRWKSFKYCINITSIVKLMPLMSEKLWCWRYYLS